MTDIYNPTKLGKIRVGAKASYDKESIHAVLDQGLIAHMGFQVSDRPVVIPMAYGRIGDKVYVHGAKATRAIKANRNGLPICLTITLIDGIVVARSSFHSSMNYRSVVLHGTANVVSDNEEIEAALAAITNHLLPDRWSEVRPSTHKEIAATGVLGVTIEEASLKQRSGMPIDDDEDYETDAWGGVLPISTVYGTPYDDGRIRSDIAVPKSVLARSS
ncbi:pyridoxamine 5'-phosphate oxidase family protein [Coralliovum pocilloporae]|uniref:pyridoxamine 5'-phosphate oxidase family protein n=1 Tax=Coralliovum pocilloporae TaxID=3066369 RepID=UPI00330798A5